MQFISWVFASANSCERISKPLTSRFVVLGIPEYTFEEFKEIVILRLKKEGILEPIAAIIAERVWSNLGSKDVRDAVKIGRLSRNIQDVDYIVIMMKKIPPK